MDVIPINLAKAEIVRINAALSAPHLLIGGLAVNQYVSTRRSLDIDLVCGDSIMQELLTKLYPSKQWSRQKAGDEYRPSYVITKRDDPVEIEIFIGPKIMERGPYPNLEWSILIKTGQPFKCDNGTTLNNIIIPSVAGLWYSKMISFLGRDRQNSEKRLNDLNDFAELTNCEVSFADFFGLVDRANTPHLLHEFVNAISTEQEWLAFQNSSIAQLLIPLRNPSSQPFSPESRINSSSITTSGILVSSKRLTTLTWLDDDQILVGGFSGKLHLLSACRMQKLDEIDTDDRMIRCIESLGDRNHVICGGDGWNLLIVNIENRTCRRFGTTDSAVYSIAVHKEGGSFYTAERFGYVDEWSFKLDNESAPPIEHIARLQDHNGEPAFAVHYDKEYARVFSAGQSGRVLITNRGSKNIPSNLRVPDPIFSIDIGADILTFSDGGGKIHMVKMDRRSGELSEEVISLVGHSANVRSIKISACTKWILSGSKDNSVRLWDVEARRSKVLFYGRDYIYAVALSPNNTRMACVDGSGACFVTEFKNGLKGLKFEGIDESTSP